MINLLCKLPKHIAVAVSGGADSMAALDFLSNRRRDITVLHFNHGSDHADEAEAFVKEYAEDNGLNLIVGYTTRDISPGESKEAFWREQRYAFFDKAVEKSVPIITCHHLDDLVETWIFTSLHGTSRLIPVQRDNFVRPFLSTRKSELVSWCSRRAVPYVTDPSNADTSYMRNYIRSVLLPNALRVNPGLHKTLRKKIIESSKAG
jgi:tRNA(Ile)-lysidine synthase